MSHFEFILCIAVDAELDAKEEGDELKELEKPEAISKDEHEEGEYNLAFICNTYEEDES